MYKARSAANGIVHRKQLDANVIKDLKNIHFVCYEQIFPKIKFLDGFHNLQKLNFILPNFTVYNKINMKKLEEHLLERRIKSNYEIDGIVVFDDSKSYPRPADKNPKYAIAFKIDEDEGEITKVINVEWNITKFKNLAPRIQIETVNLSGSEVNYTTGINAKWIFDNKIGPGTVMEMILGGDIIPKVNRIIKSSNKAQAPDYPYYWRESEVDIYVDPVEAGLEKEYQEKILTNFFKNISAKGVSEGIVAQMIGKGFNSLNKILNATVCDLGFLGPKMATKVYESIQNGLDKATLVDIMVASNEFGNGFGHRKFNSILDRYPNLIYDYKSKTQSSSLKELTGKILDIAGFQIKTAQQFAKHYFDFIKFINKHSHLHHFIEKSEKGENNEMENDSEDEEGVGDGDGVGSGSKSLKGEVIVFSGFRDAELEKKIKRLNGRVGSGVNKNTTIVIAKDPSQQTGKVKKANELGINVMNLDDFNRLMD